MRQVFNWGTQQDGQEEVVQQSLQLESLKFQLNRALKDKVKVCEKFNQSCQANQGMVKANQKLRTDFYSMQEQLKMKTHDIGAFRCSTVAKLGEHSSLLKEMGEEYEKIPKFEQQSSVMQSRLAQVELQVKEMAIQVQNLVMNFGQLAYIMQQNYHQDALSSPGGDTSNPLFTPSSTMYDYYRQVEGGGTQTKRKRLRLIHSTNAQVIRERTSGPPAEQTYYTYYNQAQQPDGFLETNAHCVPHTLDASPQLQETQCPVQSNTFLPHQSQKSLPQQDVNMQTACTDNEVNIQQNNIENGFVQQPNQQICNGGQMQVQLPQIDDLDGLHMECGENRNNLKRPPSCIQRSPQQFQKEPRLSSAENNVQQVFQQNDQQQQLATHQFVTNELQQGQLLCSKDVDGQQPRENTNQIQNLTKQSNLEMGLQQEQQQQLQQIRSQTNKTDVHQQYQQQKCVDSDLQQYQRCTNKELQQQTGLQQQQQQKCIDSQQECVTENIVTLQQQYASIRAVVSNIETQQQQKSRCIPANVDVENLCENQQVVETRSSSLLEELTPMRGGDIQLNNVNEDSGDECVGDVLRSAHQDLLDVSKQLDFDAGNAEHGNQHESTEDSMNISEGDENTASNQVGGGENAQSTKHEKNKQGTKTKSKTQQKQSNRVVTSKKKSVQFAYGGSKDKDREWQKDKNDFRESRTNDDGKQQNTGGRSSRRQRAAVNYAEPKLNSKLQKGDKIIFQGIPKMYVGSSFEEPDYYSKKKNNKNRNKKA